MVEISLTLTLFENFSAQVLRNYESNGFEGKNNIVSTQVLKFTAKKEKELPLKPTQKVKFQLLGGKSHKTGLPNRDLKGLT